jgi:hypothetical protein
MICALLRAKMVKRSKKSVLEEGEWEVMVFGG